MPFRFALDAVLRVRQSLEHQQELLLREANQCADRLEQQLNEMDAELAAVAEQRRQQLVSGLTAAELRFALLCRSVFMEHRKRLEHSLAEASAARDQSAENYRAARQQREVVETLRQRQLATYRQIETRRDQRETDDLFLLRRIPQKRG